MSFDRKNFGQFLLNLYPTITEKDILDALGEQLNSSENLRKKLGDILVEQDKITQEERDEALLQYESGFKGEE